MGNPRCFFVHILGVKNGCWGGERGERVARGEGRGRERNEGGAAWVCKEQGILARILFSGERRTRGRGMREGEERGREGERGGR